MRLEQTVSDLVGILVSILALSGFPFVLASLSWVLRRFYFRVLWGPARKRRRAQRGAAPTTRVNMRQADDVATSTHDARPTAAAVTREMQLAHVIAAAVYAAIVVFVLLTYGTMVRGGRIGIAYAAVAPMFLIVAWLLRMPRRRAWRMFGIYVLTGVVLMLVVAGEPLKAIVWSAIFAFIVTPALLLLVRRSIETFVALLLASSIMFLGVGTVIDRVQREITFYAVEVIRQNLWIVPLGLLAAVAAFLCARIVFRNRWPVVVVVFLLSVAGTVVLNQTASRQVSPAGIVAGILGFAVLQMLILAAVFEIFLWLQKRWGVTNELLHIHLAWAGLTAYFEAFAFGTPEFRQTRWTFTVAFVLSLLTLYMLLFLLRRRRQRFEPRRLLLLRVFGGPGERQELLAGLRDTWRRIGAIDVIAGTDIATQILQPAMLQAFVLHVTDQEFFRSPAEVAERWKTPRSKLEADARYPINPVYCRGDDAWHAAFLKLEKTANAILMDVRGFTRQRKGATWELERLLEQADLQRVVLLADETTSSDLDEVLAGRQVTILKFDRRSPDDRRALFDLLLDAAYA